MKRVLIVDDDVCVSRVLARIFARAGYDTSVANNGKRALAILAERSIDVLITDINMPRMDGRELCQRLSVEGPYLPDVTYIVTARMSHDERAWVDEISGLELVEKPISPKSLLQRVERRFNESSSKDAKESAA